MNEQDILEQAIKIEEKGGAYYSKQAAQTENQYAKLFFERLVEEEEEHKEMLSNALEAVEVGEDIDTDFTDIPAIDVFPEDAKRIGSGYVGALQHALDLEEKNLEFYAEASEKTSTRALKKIYNYLVDFEQAHVDRIRSELEYIENSGMGSELG